MLWVYVLGNDKKFVRIETSRKVKGFKVKNKKRYEEELQVEKY